MDEGREFVLSKLYGNTLPEKAVGLDSEIDHVFESLRNTVIQKRGYQHVLLGARSTGKTLVVEKAISRLQTEFPDQCIIIRINGLSHSDDKLALREIAKQLDVAINTNEEPIEKPSMSQTLKSLNQLFEAASQTSLEDETADVKRIVFVVEEMDKYITAHQVFAYELLDWSLSCPWGVSVISTSTRMNIMDLMEKRNRSRNSSVVVTLSKPKSVESLVEIGRELLSGPNGEWLSLISEEDLYELSSSVWFTTNSVRQLMSLLLPRVLNIENPSIMVPSTTETLLRPLDSVAEIDWSLIICAARAVVRYETASVNLVLVLDEWRSLTNALHSTRFAEISAHLYAQHETADRNELNSRNTTNGGNVINGANGSPQKYNLMKPGSTPSSLLAVRHSWERLQNLGLIEPCTTQSTQEDLKMFVPELDLHDLKGHLPRSHPLYEWTNFN